MKKVTFRRYFWKHPGINDFLTVIVGGVDDGFGLHAKTLEEAKEVAMGCTGTFTNHEGFTYYLGLPESVEIEKIKEVIE